MLPLINRFPNKPLIYNIAWKTVIYWLMSAVLHYLERLIDFWRETGGFVAGNEKLLAEIIWPHFWAIQILLFVLIAMYCTVHELVRVIGREKAAADILRTDACAGNLSEALIVARIRGHKNRALRDNKLQFVNTRPHLKLTMPVRLGILPKISQIQSFRIHLSTMTTVILDFATTVT